MRRGMKGSTCAPDTESTLVVWRIFGCTIGSSAAWQERDGLQRADHPHDAPAVVAISANSVASCDAMLSRDAGLQYACTTRERHHRACVHALTITHTCPRSSAEAAAPRTSGWRCRRRNHSSEGRTGRSFEVHEGNLQEWRPRPVAAATATIVKPEHARRSLLHASILHGVDNHR